MTRLRRIAIAVACCLVAAVVVLILRSYFRPIKVPLHRGMSRSEVRSTLEKQKDTEYNFYSDKNWCSRGMFALGEFFSYHTWIGFTFDDSSRLNAARGYHALTIELPLIGFHDYEFPVRDIKLPESDADDNLSQLP